MRSQEGLAKWAKALQDENNSLGDTLIEYSNEWQAEIEQLREALVGLRNLLHNAQSYLTEHLKPDGPDQRATLRSLYQLMDGPIQEAKVSAARVMLGIWIPLPVSEPDANKLLEAVQDILGSAAYATYDDKRHDHFREMSMSARLETLDGIADALAVGKRLVEKERDGLRAEIERLTRENAEEREAFRLTASALVAEVECRKDLGRQLAEVRLVISDQAAKLAAVLCEPDGTCCIEGSTEDCMVVNRALDALAALGEKGG